MSKGSSLERAAAASRGAFEACFSNGLDLSDFTNSSSVTPVISHSASLLRRKQVEVAQKLEQEKEESDLEAILQDCKEAMQRAKTKEKPTLAALPPLPLTHIEQHPSLFSHHGLKKSDMISTAVLAMHMAEQREEPKQKLGKRRATNKLLSTRRPQHTMKKNAPAIKKSVRAKYK